MTFIKSLPKTEVHLHLEACVNKQTLRKMFKKNGMNISEEEFERKYMFHDLNGFIQLFLFIQSAVKEPEDFSFMINSLAEYMRTDNILYSEVFVAPTKFIQNGLNFEKMMEVIVQRIREIKQEDGTDINILVDVSRTFGSENAMNNLNRVIKLKYPEVIGIGLGGAELMGPAKDYEAVFRKAKEEGLRTVVHAGEDEGPISIWDSINYLKTERIGHGTSAILDQDLVEYLKDSQIPIEICLTSNVFTGKYVKKEENHPVRQYFDQGLFTCVNTDDPEIFDVNLSYEYFKMYRFLNFNIDELVTLIKKGVYASFHPDKEQLWSKFEKDIKKLRKKHSL
jgi:adenosine deaminase